MSQHHRQARARSSHFAVIASLTAMFLATAPASGQTYLDGGGGSSSRPQSSEPTGGFLDGGGPLQPRRGVRNGQRRDGFLDDGGGVGRRPDIVVRSGGDREFLRDGGSIRTPADIVYSDEREEFLEDGGSVVVEPDILVDDRRLRRGRGWREVAAPRTAQHSSGSFTVITSDLGDRGYGSTSQVSGTSANRMRTRAKIIDVESARLDRRPMPASSVEVIYKIGGPQIIRIAPGYGQRVAALATDSADGSRPTARAELEQVERAAPWTREWLDRCTSEHESFDPDYGTYVDAKGQSQFCD